MLHVAFILLCIAQIIHFSRHLALISMDQYAGYSDRKLKSHLKWQRKGMDLLGSTRPGSATQRY